MNGKKRGTIRGSRERARAMSRVLGQEAIEAKRRKKIRRGADEDSPDGNSQGEGSSSS